MSLDPRVGQLLRAIATQELLPGEERDVELALPRQSNVGHDSSAERVIQHRGRELIDSLGEPFETGLRAAAQLATSGRNEIVLDSRDALQNHLADALIQFLVRPRLATVRTQEPETGRYVYAISVDWPALRQFAAEAGVAIEEVIGPSTTSPSSS